MAISMKTSKSHPLQIAEIPLDDPYGSAVGLTFCPGKIQPKSISGNWCRDLATDLLAIKQWGAAAIVTLMPQIELEMVKVGNMGDECEALGMEWYHLPIIDVNVPDSYFEHLWIYAGLRLRNHLSSGRKVLIHCRGGLGRTGTIAGRLLVEMGWDANKAINEVRGVRPGAIETEAQKNHVMNATKPRYDDAFVERMLGCLIGGAVGDGFGYPVEFTSLKDIKKKFGSRGIKKPIFSDEKLVVSDDTQMTLFTLEGLLFSHLQSKDWDINHIKHTVFAAYSDWLYTQGGKPSDRLSGQLAQSKAMHYQRAPGNTCINALKLGMGGDIDRAINNSKGCGAVMRTAPVGFIPNNNRNNAQRIGETLGALTHGHLDGWLPAGALAGMVERMMQGSSLHEAAHQVIDHLKTYPSGEIARRQRTYPLLTLAEKLISSHKGRSEEAIRLLGQGWTGEEALAIALYATGTAKNFADCIRRAANHDGDSDSTASIAGQLYGVWKGVFAIPHAWVRRIDVLNEILMLAWQWVDNVECYAPPVVRDRTSPDFREIQRFVQNVFTMVQVLHGRGYQKLRVSPGLSPSGCYYRVLITSVENIRSNNGAEVVEYFENTVLYTTGAENRYFNWQDASDDNPEELADKFIKRFPELANAGKGRDWEYVGWYIEMMGFVNNGHFPLAYFDYWYDPPVGTMHLTSQPRDRLVLLAPPGGDGSCLRENGDDRDDDYEVLFDEEDIDLDVVSSSENQDIEENEEVDSDSDSSELAPLTSYDLSNRKQRIEALFDFYSYGLEKLIPFTQQIWSQLSEPKAESVAHFAKIAGIKGSGKLALRKILIAFYEEASAARDSIMISQNTRSSDSSSSGFEELLNALKQLVDMNEALRRVAKKYAWILEGVDPSSSDNIKSGEIITGPWDTPV